jgi:hypothetical protein
MKGSFTMRRQVTITFNIDPEDYHEAEDTPEGAIDLVIDCLNNRADLPEEEDVTISCQGVSRVSNDHR